MKATFYCAQWMWNSRVEHCFYTLNIWKRSKRLFMMLLPSRNDGLHGVSHSNIALYGVRNQWHSTLMQPHSSACGPEGKTAGFRGDKSERWRGRGFWFEHTPWAPSSSSSSPPSKMRGGAREAYALFNEGPLFCCYDIGGGGGGDRKMKRRDVIWEKDRM